MDHEIWCVPSAPNPNILKARRAQDEHVIPPTADPAVRSRVTRLVFQQFDQLAVRSTKEGYPKWPGFFRHIVQEIQRSDRRRRRHYSSSKRLGTRDELRYF